MGGFLGIGGSSAKTDRGNFLGGLKGLSNVFNYALPTGKEMVSGGEELLGKAGDYYSKLLSGNRSAVMGAVAPETNAIRAGADASKRQVASMGTARGGGTAAINRQRETDTNARIDNALFGVRPAAAKGAESVANTQLAAAFKALGLGEEAISTITDESRLSRPDSQKINQEMVAKVAQTAINVLSSIPL